MEIRCATSDDLPAIQRIWREVGWVDDDGAPHVAPFLEDATTYVAALDGEAEASGSVHHGSMSHTGTDVATAFVTSITTSRIGRRQGLARQVLDRLLLDAADDGAALSVLGMFEQGFYDRSGFGTGAEMVFHRLDPASLSAALPYRRPVRLGVEDAPALTAALARRERGHGGVVLPSVAMRRAELEWTDGGFGLGYRGADGDLTHFVWCSATGEHGPYRVRTWAWREPDQLLELLGALRSLGDQVRWLTIPEPWCLQLQTLTTFPGRQYLLTKGSENDYRVVADAWWQARILDLPAAVGALRSRRPSRFRLTLTDPLTDIGFDRVAGDWTLTLTTDGSEAVRGHDGADVDLTCSVNTFTRLWLGVREPSTVLTTDHVDTAPHVAHALDAAIALPRPDVGHDF